MNYANNNEINAVLLERKCKLIVFAENQSADNARYVIALMRNIESLGFTFSQSLFDALRYQPVREITSYYEFILPILRRMVGANVAHKPFYLNFPRQVAKMSDLEWILNALFHYWTLGEWKPDYVKESRFPLMDGKPQVRVIDLGTVEEFNALFANMMAASGSLSENDRKLLVWYIKNSNPDTLAAYLPASIPSKETLAVVAATILANHKSHADLLKRYFKTATDVLRLAVSMSGGDISLAENTHFRNFTRAERRFLLGLLETDTHLAENMAMHAGLWIRLGEKLHPGEYANMYPRAYEAFSKIRNGKVQTFNSRVTAAWESGDVEGTLNLLKGRGGELVRRLDSMLRSAPGYHAEILSAFETVSDSVATPVLLQTLAHFEHRNEERQYRAFFPKGNLAKAYVVENNLPPMRDDIRLAAVSALRRTLLRRFAGKPALGKVYIAPELAGVLVPLAQRSASNALKSFARGSRFAIGEDAKVVRAFIHWRNPDPDKLTDVDLSVMLYDENWQFREQVSYTNIRSREYPVYHSGDVRNAPEGASEFIDLDVDALREAGVRYAIFSVHSYSEQPFNVIPECFFGWMEREFPQSGEIYEPNTVVNKSDLTANTRIAVPVVLDLFERQCIWTDLALKKWPGWYNNIHANGENLLRMAVGIMDTPRPNLYDLFLLHVEARGGELVENRENAELAIALDGEADITPFDTEVILLEYL